MVAAPPPYCQPLEPSCVVGVALGEGSAGYSLLSAMLNGLILHAWPSGTCRPSSSPGSDAIAVFMLSLRHARHGSPKSSGGPLGRLPLPGTRRDRRR